MLPVLLSVVVVVLLLREVFLFYRRRAALPPSPFAVPMLGNFINDIKPPYLADGLRRISRKFGSVSTFFMPFPVVNVADYETMKEVFRNPDVTGRMRNILFETTRCMKNGGIILSDGDDWQEQRRFAIATLRDLGMGKNLMEEKIRFSAASMTDFLAKQDLEDVDLRWPIQVFVANIINEFLFGVTYPFDDCEKLTNFVLSLVDAVKTTSESKLLPIIVMVPWLRHLPIINHYWEQHRRSVGKWLDYVKEQTAQVKFDPQEAPTCYVQAFLKHSKDQRPEQLHTCCTDLFLAGLETSTTTLRWAMLYLAAHQDVQEKVRAEISNHLESGTTVRMSDKPNLPYSSAVLLEIQRCANIIAPNVILFHRTTVDTEIDGFKIPADTLVNCDLHQLMRSDPLFAQPDRFWPERYLSEDGKTLRKELVDRTIPFGIGKRQCAGEGLARVTLFIGVVTLVQNFRIRTVLPVDFEPIYTTVHFPKPHNFLLERL